MDFVIICRKALYFRGSLSICPAYAGMIPSLLAFMLPDKDLSRVCGDDPIKQATGTDAYRFVPRMRG